MENYQQKIDELLRKAKAQGAARAAKANKPFITNIVVAEKPKEDLKSLKDIWRGMDAMDSRNTTPANRFRKAGKSTKGKKPTKSSTRNKKNRTNWQPYHHSNMENFPVQSPTFSERSSIITDEDGDVLMMSAASTPKEITPPNRNILNGYFPKGKRKPRSTEFISGDKLNDASPDTLRILKALQSNDSNGELDLDKGYELENVSND
ncbi:11092_t:CDS:2 [Funneliformis geosporum]|uniref:8424_t:CDS:1 n=1 Tax=Funneliformis geosporum TaxID=1117311 RepID=A0A9W4SLA2_9GLOM|nr:8424_t:CDS:2 [Funneliformis geosporum]CAI2180030.1 11092_t:CDS:2 [Funneliformis geosporum]